MQLKGWCTYYLNWLLIIKVSESDGGAEQTLSWTHTGILIQTGGDIFFDLTMAECHGQHEFDVCQKVWDEQE